MSVDPRLMEQIAEMKRRQMALSGMPQQQSNYAPPPPTQDAGMASKPAGTMQTLALRQMMFNQDESNRNFSRGNFESDRTFDYGVGRDKRNDFVTDRNYGRGVLESDRGFNRGVLESDRGFKRGVLESDRGFNRGVLEDDRNFGRGVLENNRAFGRGAFESDRGFERGVVLESDRGYNLDRDRESRLSAGDVEGGNAPPSATDSETRLYFDGMAQRDETGNVLNKTALEQAIMEDPNISDYTAYQLTIRYGIPWQGDVPSPNQ